MQTELTAQRLREVLDYDPATGVFTWTAWRNYGKAQAGVVAGSTMPVGYVQIRVDYRRYYAHRLAWFYVHGGWPEVIDHINGNRADNRIANLRSVSQQVNMQNIRVTRNKLGFPGVTLHHQSGLYNAAIKVNKVKKSLGYYQTPEQAHAAYAAAKTVRDGA